MNYPTVKAGQTNPAVAAMQAGLHRALAKADLPHKNNRRGGYGSRTIEDVNRFKRKYVKQSGPVNGKYFGTAAWLALEPYLGAYDRLRIRRHNRAVAKAKKDLAAKKAAQRVGELTSSAARELLKQTSLRFYSLRGNYVYKQYRPMPGCLFCRAAHYRLDCSSAVTEIFRESGRPDPNGLGYNGYGFTGTLWNHGRLTQSPQAGDLAFYGVEGTSSAHVAIHVSPTAVVSFGSTPIKHLYYRYRSDYRGSRSYL